MSLLNPYFIPLLHLGGFNGCTTNHVAMPAMRREMLGGKIHLDLDSPFLCTSCVIDLPSNDPVFHCQKLGTLLLIQTFYDVTNVREESRNIDESLSVFVYNEIVLDWILQLKFFVQSHLSSLLGRFLVFSFQNRAWLVKFDGLIPIPLYSPQLRK